MGFGCDDTFFQDGATSGISTLSLHDALPILVSCRWSWSSPTTSLRSKQRSTPRDRKSTRLNSSHSQISYAVFCLKKKNEFNNSYFGSKSVIKVCKLYTNYT